MTVTTIVIEGLDTLDVGHALELRIQGQACIRIHTIDTSTPCYARNIVHTEIDHLGTDFILGGDCDEMRHHCMEGTIDDDFLDGTQQKMSDEEQDELLIDLRLLWSKKWEW